MTLLPPVFENVPVKVRLNFPENWRLALFSRKLLAMVRSPPRGCIEALPPVIKPVPKAVSEENPRTPPETEVPPV